MKNDKKPVDVFDKTIPLINIEELYKIKKEPKHRLFDDNEKLPLILFSGGLDSTYLLSETLKTGSCDIIYISGPQGKLKIDAEKKACEKIIKWLEKNRPYKIRKEYSVDISSLPVFTNESFGQVPFWIFGALATCNQFLHSTVQIAYVMGDQISSFLTNIHVAWGALSLVTKHRTVDLYFPLTLITKKYIMKQMEPKLYKLTWVCELPVYKIRTNDKLEACGTCPACITRKVEEYRLTLT